MQASSSDYMRKCLTALSQEHREIIDLVYYHEKSVKEVSEILDIPEATVKTRMFYARKKLKEMLLALETRQMPSAMGNKVEPGDMSEAHLTAPWYVTGKLDEAEARELEELAKDDPELALIIEEAKREAQADIALNEFLGSLPRACGSALNVRSKAKSARRLPPGERVSSLGSSPPFRVFSRRLLSAAMASRSRGCRGGLRHSGRRHRLSRSKPGTGEVQHRVWAAERGCREACVYRFLLAESHGGRG